MTRQLIAGFFLIGLACGQVKSDPGSTGTDSSRQDSSDLSGYSPVFEKAHPNAKQLMTEEFYFSPIEETGPFGSDDGADAYATFNDWRQTHKNEKPGELLTQLLKRWSYPVFDIDETDFNKISPYLQQDKLNIQFLTGIDAAIAAIAFGQLYLEGTIDSEFNSLAKVAIRRELLPEILALWPEDYRHTREMQLTKMLEVLKKVN